MSNLFNAMCGNTYSTTANGAVTLPDSGNALVDLFGAIGSSRGNDLSRMFSAAFGNNTVSNVLATRILLWARDIRGGAGERQTFRSLLPLIEEYDITLAKAIARKIPEVGRWDDLLHFESLEMTDFCDQLIADGLFANNALCAKWMPRKGPTAVRLRNYMGLSPRDYRKMLVGLTNVVETKMCRKEWLMIDYSKLPSVASSRYGKAFIRNDETRYRQYLDAIEKGEAKVNAGALFPHDLVHRIGDQRQLCNAQWKALPDYIDGNTENFLCMVDVSPSMRTGINGTWDGPQCMDVSIALGLYMSERSNGIFKDSFMTFSDRPTIETVNGSLSDRVRQTRRANWGGTTNFQAAFEKILSAAVQHNLPERDMPTKLLVFSDMEFNQADRGNTNFMAIEDKYKKAGYKRPDIVFWNLNAREGNSPVRFDQSGTALVSGFSPSLMKSILSGKSCTPFNIMMETIMSERYNLESNF